MRVLFEKIVHIIGISAFLLFGMFFVVDSAWADSCVFESVDGQMEYCVIGTPPVGIVSFLEQEYHNLFAQSCQTYCQEEDGFEGCRVDPEENFCPGSPDVWSVTNNLPLFALTAEDDRPGTRYAIRQRVSAAVRDQNQAGSVCIQEVQNRTDLNCELDLGLNNLQLPGWNNPACAEAYNQCFSCNEQSNACVDACTIQNPEEPALSACVVDCISKQSVCDYRNLDKSGGRSSKKQGPEAALRERLKTQCLSGVFGEGEQDLDYLSCMEGTEQQAMESINQKNACVDECVEKKLAQTEPGCYCNVYGDGNYLNNRRIDELSTNRGLCLSNEEDVEKVIGGFTLAQCEWVDPNRESFGADTGELLSDELKESVASLNRFGAVSIPELIGKGIFLVMGIIGTIAVTLVIYAGLMRALSAGRSDWVNTSNDILFWVAVGVLGIFISFAIASFIFTELF